MYFVLVVVLFAAPGFASADVQKCPENTQRHEEGALLSHLYRSKALWSPLYRFKVLDEEPGSRPQYKKVQDFHQLREQCLQSGKLFEDPEFDAVPSSIYYNETRSSKYGDVEWLRPGDIYKYNVKFINERSSQFAVKQGSQGDCWFMAVVASIASKNDSVFAQMVPTDQSFTEKYCGIFHFRFWQMGHWIDVVVDDRLPTRYHSLLFAKASDDREYWAPLLEKAYAKLYGSYDALNGGRELEAMEDLTGGVSVMFDLKKLLPTPDLFRIMQKSLTRQSILSAGMEKETSEGAVITKKGLPNNHAYSVTGVISVEYSINNRTEKAQLVRVRNPWGQTEWKGSWSDGSPEWKLVSTQVKEEIGWRIREDGEYWMAYDDFVNLFDEVTICAINPNILPATPQESRMRWEVSAYKGEWVRGATTGGCSVATLHKNPQYQITLLDSDDDSKLATMYVELMQESQRALRNLIKGDEQYLVAGFVIYKVENSTSLPLSSEYIHENKWYETSTSYSLVDQRQIAYRFRVPPGVYVIIPCTQRADVEGEFILRIVTEKKNRLKSF